ncbi:Eco57I restriction-modification methylase domain-containing protein [Bathymodiolus thermophilus thioautotrophic gill symbiont]|uniref:site-specific DNA-methyltransferase (adenine-specific) n=1 Tax=Bathymodiolus thermophilus thioautotrophic gill symbiont TaxID=2360 RepID=A0A1J5UG28_9GAMM|nr:Eco57I restriction-modification methylase domain-containing protein [Bathymodiolus thermophilus thioautotrophic gill symbiont]AYQ57043.1 Putative O-methyltransferase [Bathymodiolus thermophilus thioautotrophic gill symbiont]OIR24885.1 methyltransferase [Bathymodiolus thermophilus thioautotrophic gill symbiont]
MNQQVLFELKNDITCLQRDFLRSKSMKVRKSLGQFFTGSVVSNYMASLLSNPKSETIRILDAGAGTGILTASTALYFLDTGCKTVHAVLYELDSDALINLEETLKIVRDAFKLQQATFTYDIYCEDFVLTRPDKDKSIQSFDVSVINPPYFKYSAKESPYAKATADLYKGDPNIYASFMAVALACLRDKGQMVTITPRSFANGLYFKGFRAYLLSKLSLELVHIFKHRGKVFNSEESSVLQENIICYFVKGGVSNTITVRSSYCDLQINSAKEGKHPVDLIIDSSNDQKFIRIPESDNEANILNQAESLETTFEKAGYFISTGRVVEHRTRGYITTNTDTENTVPLYRPHNITPLTATWTGEHKKEVSFILKGGYAKHIIENNTYLLLKRFSPKDEKRRLIAGVHLANKHTCKLIGFGNKTNYIGVTNDKLSATEAYGLAAVFNSSFMDKYFRCISGNTQVNATEIRTMKFPGRDQVKEMGKQVQKLKTFDTTKIDLIVNQILGVISSSIRGEN